MKLLEKIKTNYILIGILFLAALLRIYHIDFQSIWLDEIITMKECDPRLTFKESYEIMAIWENNPVIYYYLVKINSIVFGHTTFVVRMFSAVIGILSIYLLYLLGKEINDKKTGLIAAFLATINYFFIYYSQEARAYILLTFFTILTFYQLIRFLKNNNILNAILYGLSLTLMMNTHFFGLFVVVSHVVILLVYLFETDKKDKIRFIKNGAIAGVIALSIWYYLSWDIFKIASEIKAFWIPQPTLELITGIFREFFGNSEAILFMVSILVIFYFIKLFSIKQEKKLVSSNKFVFGFIILSIWILITIYVPYLRSYLQIPMITSRYIIVVLPAIIILVSVSISLIESNFIKKVILIFLTIASLTDLLVVKKYYTQVHKTQYREITDVIKQKNISNSKIISSWGWHVSYFFNKDTKKDLVVYKNLQDYTNELITSNKKEAFWYMDFHARPYSLSPELEKFLNENYNVVENLEYFDAWAKYYVPKASGNDLIALNINEFEPIKSDNDVNILLFSNSTTSSKPVLLEPGDYRLAIKAKSIPEVPVNNENAHLTLSLSGKKIAAYFLTEKAEEINYFQFNVNKKQGYKVELTFDNDLVLNNADRNALIFSVIIEKVKNKY